MTLSAPMPVIPIPQGSITLLGIDPGLSETGWGVIIVDEKQGIERYVASGRISTTAKEELAVRLRHIFRAILQVIEDYTPVAVAIEEVFVNRNPTSSMKLCHGRAAAILAAAHKDIPVHEFHNRTIKSAIVGKGNADKHQMLAMIQFLLPNIATSNEHEVDALCIALCAQHHRQSAFSGILVQ